MDDTKKEQEREYELRIGDHDLLTERTRYN